MRAMDSNGRPGWWTYKKGNGMLSLHSLSQLTLIWHFYLSRYSNMDLALITTLMLAIQAGITCVLISYDIACQWYKNLQKRLAMYSISSSFLLSTLLYWHVVIPKFHLRGHGKICQLKFNMNFTKGAGRMTGEMIESGWAQSGPIAISTRENEPFA